mmetsp:Transcript_40036/g.110246  ORF Transcript_40036/g.110246 Transcript_40036/m.110246 type:complete len:225 (+) Transcript_40036:1453-2127(+)
MRAMLSNERDLLDARTGFGSDSLSKSSLLSFMTSKVGTGMELQPFGVVKASLNATGSSQASIFTWPARACVSFAAMTSLSRTSRGSSGLLPLCRCSSTTSTGSNTGAIKTMYTRPTTAMAMPDGKGSNMRMCSVVKMEAAMRFAADPINVRLLPSSEANEHGMKNCAGETPMRIAHRERMGIIMAMIAVFGITADIRIVGTIIRSWALRKDVGAPMIHMMVSST